MSECRCGQLNEWADDARIPVERLDAARSFICRLSETEQREIFFCPFCGGDNGLPHRHECKCDALEEWVRVKNSVVHYNESNREFYLLFGRDERLFFYFCPVCGGSLPESKRSSLFMVPSIEEKETIQRKLEGAISLKDVEAALGTPDAERDDPGYLNGQRGLLGPTAVRKALFFYSSFRTLEVVAQELEDGTLQIFYLGKPIGETGRESIDS